MSALERKREFSVMLALGTPPWWLQLQLLVEAALLGLLGCSAGVLLGSGAALAVDGADLTGLMPDGMQVGGFLIEPTLAMHPRPETLLWLAGGSFVAILIMSGLPMIQLRSIRMTDAFR